ncbi:MAG: ATP-binding protein [Candidatus Saganbacteria bacterium]|nr:ATP-binding protein [Candidatus Saganbacteria bacterium]
MLGQSAILVILIAVANGTSAPLIQFGQGVFLFMLCFNVWAYHDYVLEKNYKTSLPLGLYKQISFVTITAILLAGLFFTSLVGGNVKEDTLRDANNLLGQAVINSNTTFANSHQIAENISGSPSMKPALISPTPANIALADEVLSRFQKKMEVTACYMLDRHGAAIASSDRNDPNTVLHKNFSSNYYFIQALSGSGSSFSETEINPDTRTDYAAAPVKNNTKQVIGVIVVKQSIGDELIRYLPLTFVINKQGLILLANPSKFYLRMLWPISKEEQQTLLGPGNIKGISRVPLLNKKPEDNTSFYFRGTEYVFLTKDLSEQDWQIVYFTPLYAYHQARLLTILMFALLALSFIVAFYALFQKSFSAEIIFNEKERFFTTLHSIGDGVLVVDLDKRVTLVNTAAEKLTGWTEEDALGRKLEEVFVVLNESTRKPRENPVDTVLKTKEIAYLANHTILISKNGEEKVIADSAAPIHDRNEVMVGVVLTFRDVSERAKLETELKNKIQELSNIQKAMLNINDDLSENEKEIKAKNIELERLYKIKTEFTSMVSHELRTPLTAIKEGISIVLDGSSGPVTPQQNQFLEIAKRNVDRLHHLVNEVLDLSRLESGKIDLHIKPGNLAETVLEAVNSQKLIAEKKGLTLQTQIEENLPTVAFDHERIIEVVNNLLDNAFKFTDQGGITILVQKDNFNHGIKVCVADTGIGISKENITRLFEPYIQIGEVNRKTGGTGLGLNISKQIITQHLGTMWIEAEPGKGSSFWFTIPGMKK